MNSSQIIPLFPLGVVLLPEMNMPLHIFEERYKLMMKDCLEEQKGFGLVYYDGAHIKTTGCVARITRVIKRYSDGRMDILTKGQWRFEIEEIFENKSYLEAKVQLFDDDDIDDPDIKYDISDRAKALINELAALNKKAGETFTFNSINSQQLSFIIAGMDGFSYDEKQEFLEMRSTEKRLKKGVEVLAKIIERIKLNAEIKKIVGGNGHMPELFR